MVMFVGVSSNGQTFLIAHKDRTLCRCGISIPSARKRCPAFDKNKYLEPMFGHVGQARTNADMLMMPIATTSSRTCTKPTPVFKNYKNNANCNYLQNN